MQPGHDRTYGNSFRPPAVPLGPGQDFLGLDDELQRRTLAAQPRLPPQQVELGPVPASVPQREHLAPGARLSGNWPPVVTNTWRVSDARVSAPPAPPVASERPSWLLELDDAAVLPAHPAFVRTSAPANTSFRDGTEVVQRVAPWFVRSLCVFAGLFLCAVITRTILARSARPDFEPAEPVQPTARVASRAESELLAPAGVGSANRAKPGDRSAWPSAGQRGSSVVSAAASESPALAVYPLPDEVVPVVRPEFTSEADPAGIERWLAQQSRGAAPLADAGSVRPESPSSDGAVPPNAAGAAGVWEGATIPVEALAGGLRLSTPSVGRVRVRLEGGGRAEGRLTAIGQGRVWLETDAGPLEIANADMRGLEQIADRPPTATPPQVPQRQRVRTAGGVFFGRVLARDGRTVTLITDAGTRVTVEAEEISDTDGN
jgi:hypothetical protein